MTFLVLFVFDSLHFTNLLPYLRQSVGVQPFDTPASQAAQGERTLTNWVSASKAVRAES